LRRSSGGHGPGLRLRKNAFDFGMGARNHMNRDEFTNSPCGGRTSVGRGFHCTDITTDEHGDVSGPDVLGPNKGNVRGFDHRIGCLNRANETSGFDHP